MAKYRFIGPRDRHTETGAIVVHGETIGFGQEFEANVGLVESLSDRFVFERLDPPEGKDDDEDDEDKHSKDVTIEAPQVVAKGRPFPTEGR